LVKEFYDRDKLAIDYLDLLKRVKKMNFFKERLVIEGEMQVP
jgi:hypothetical protein